MAQVLARPEQNPADRIETSSFIRGLDLVASSLGLLLLAPLFLLVGIAVRLSSPGPVFYRAKRVGQGGCVFGLYKFRSMYRDADKNGPGITLKDDPRVTPVGRFLRRTKLDELPQLINVFRGEMGLVGPRPEDPRYVALYSSEQRRVLSVQPGITSPASLHYRDEEALLDGHDWETVYRERILPSKLALDLAYLRQRTVWTDLALICRTIVVLIRGKERLGEIVVGVRNRHLFLLDTLALLLIPALALTLRLGRLSWWSQMGQALLFFTVTALMIKLVIFYVLHLYDRYWRYAGVNDLFVVVVVVGLSTAVLTILFVCAHTALEQCGLAMFRTVPLIDGVLTGLVVGGSRFGVWVLYHWCHCRRDVRGGRRVLIVGAGESGSIVAREMWANPQLHIEPVAFVDDDPVKGGTWVQGLSVVGTCAQIPKLVRHLNIRRIVVALPSVPLPRRREIVALCESTGVDTYSLPGMYELLAGYKTVSYVPDVDVQRLLHRAPIEVDHSEVGTALKGATVLVTGAGGSIGSELCRQIARYDPAAIILLGHGENSIFEITLDLRLSFPHLITVPAIVDVRDRARVNCVVKDHRPDVIFHAAAHKHVPFMEECVDEALTNNVLGTWNVLQAAEQYGVEGFVLISTDKAVHPVGVMGATKRLAELLTVNVAQRSGRAYLVVRFGNVLGSRGSVIPVFQQQIAAGGPVTITHPDMCRYFLTIAEAVGLVLQAFRMGRGGEIFVLDMGKPVRILDLAIDLIKLLGLEPGRDIEILHTGIRPGEKLSEELFFEGEECWRTEHPKILVATDGSVVVAGVLEPLVMELVNLATRMKIQGAGNRMRALLPEVCRYIDDYDHRPMPQPLPPKPTGTPEALRTRRRLAPATSVA